MPPGNTPSTAKASTLRPGARGNGTQSASNANGARCPLWVISRHMQCKMACPLCPQKRRGIGMSAKGHSGHFVLSIRLKRPITTPYSCGLAGTRLRWIVIAGGWPAGRGRCWRRRLFVPECSFVRSAARSISGNTSCRFSTVPCVASIQALQDIDFSSRPDAKPLRIRSARCSRGMLPIVAGGLAAVTGTFGCVVGVCALKSGVSPRT